MMPTIQRNRTKSLPRGLTIIEFIVAFGMIAMLFALFTRYALMFRQAEAEMNRREFATQELENVSERLVHMEIDELEKMGSEIPVSDLCRDVLGDPILHFRWIQLEEATVSGVISGRIELELAWKEKNALVPVATRRYLWRTVQP